MPMAEGEAPLNVDKDIHTKYHKSVLHLLHHPSRLDNRSVWVQVRLAVVGQPVSVVQKRWLETPQSLLTGCVDAYVVCALVGNL